MGSGERDSIELCGQFSGTVAALVTDDYLAFVAATRLQLKAWMLPDLVLRVVERQRLTAEVGEAILNTIRPRYRRGVIEHTLVGLQEVKQHGEGSGTG
jgi:hypothetical protein